MLVWKGHKKHKDLQWIHLTHLQKAWFSVVKPYAHHLHPLIGFFDDYIDADLEPPFEPPGIPPASPQGPPKP